MARITKAVLKDLACEISFVTADGDGLELQIDVSMNGHDLYTCYVPAGDLTDLAQIQQDAEDAAADEEIDDETLIRAFSIEYRSGESEDVFEGRRYRAEQAIAAEVGRRARARVVADAVEA